MIDNIKKLSHELRLYGIHAAAERCANQEINDNLHPLEFLTLVLHEEQINRKERVAKSLTTRAKFRIQSTLEDWDNTFERGISKVQVRALGILTFYHNRENLILLGATGTGKTHLAVALGKRLCSEGISVGFFSMNLLFEEYVSEKLAGRYMQMLRRLRRTNVLIFDDFGLRNYTHAEATVLMDIIEDRYQKGAIIITSQVDPQGWSKLFEYPVMAEALLDRLTQPSKKVTLKGGSYRAKLSKKSDTQTDIDA